jgi:DNA-binding NarL/FixJ family response regulator
VTTVLLVDDQALVRAGFRMVLEHHGIDVIGEAADGAAAVEAAARLVPDVVLMDLRMPRLDGVAATRAVVAAATRAGTPTRVLVLTTFDLDEHVVDAVRAGASGFLLKDVAPEDLVHAVRVVARGEAMLAPALTRRLLERFAGRAPGGRRPAALATLSERETDVVRLVARGLSNGEIAAELLLGETTVKTYLSRVLTKLGLRDRVQVAVLAYESGLVEPGSAG